MASDKHMLIFAAGFSPPYMACALLSLIVFSFVSIGDTPMNGFPVGALQISLTIMLIGYVVISLVEFFIIKHAFATISIGRIFAMILLSWISGLLSLGGILVLWSLIMGGFRR